MFHVKQPMQLDDLIRFLARLNYTLSEKQNIQFVHYITLLKKWSARCHLISIKDLNHIIERHFLPCILLSEVLDKQPGSHLLDIGTGAGFPGIVLKIMQPDLDLVLIDSVKKKYFFLKELCEWLDIDCEIICQRVEQYATITERKFDFIVNRAVAPLAVLWQWALPLLKETGCFYAMKGGDCTEELMGLNMKLIKLDIFYPPSSWTHFSNFLLGKFVVKLSFNIIR
jgi:16S rRNA (guanine527-N7)-methyltransferase